MARSLTIRTCLGAACALLLTTFCACGSLRSVMNAEEIEWRMRCDQIRFFDRTSDAYRILAYEYYKLAAEAEAAHQNDRAKDYAARVTLYDGSYRRAKKTANDLRASLKADSSPSAGAAPTAQAAAGVSRPADANPSSASAAQHGETSGSVPQQRP